VLQILALQLKKIFSKTTLPGITPYIFTLPHQTCVATPATGIAPIQYNMHKNYLPGTEAGVALTSTGCLATSRCSQNE